jgi:hypothetical protein
MTRAYRADATIAENCLNASYGLISAVADSLTESSAMLPSRCAGWTTLDLLCHQLMDARRALSAFASPSAAAPDSDYVAYWRPFVPGGDGSARHARQVRIVASAYSPGQLAAEWRETAEPALRAAHACQHQALSTQGLTLRTGDLMATLAVEAAIHYLDLTVSLPAAPASDPSSLALVREVLEALAGAPLPLSWDDAACALKGSGRLALTPDDLLALGPVAAKLPLLG